MGVIKKTCKLVSERIKNAIALMGIVAWDSYFVEHNSRVFWDRDGMDGMASLTKALAKRGTHFCTFSEDPQEVYWAISDEPLTKATKKLFIKLVCADTLPRDFEGDFQLDDWRKLGLVSKAEEAALRKAMEKDWDKP